MLKYFRTMAEDHQKSIPQVAWVIQKIHGKLRENKFSRKVFIELGDKLYSKNLLIKQPRSTWEDVKKGDMTSVELFKKIKDESMRTFATRDIFMNWLRNLRLNVTGKCIIVKFYFSEREELSGIYESSITHFTSLRIMKSFIKVY